MIPVILFAYARPDLLNQTLECLKQNHIPLLYAFSDGAKTPERQPAVEHVRQQLRAIDWCEVKLVERKDNWGLGRSILAGVTQVLQQHEAVIVFEDDLVCVPGTYDYLCCALDNYRNENQVMSITGWTHPHITPSDVINQPYFDGRAECWVWGTWQRAWHGMQDDAKTLMQKCRTEGIDIYRYGADLPMMAEIELEKNIWAVRFLYWHLLNSGLCIRPPWSMVEHIGFTADATNAKAELWLKNPPLQPSPPIPVQWPEVIEHPACSSLHQKVCGSRPTILRRVHRFARRMTQHTLRTIALK